MYLEKKLQAVQCNNCQKVLLTSHQLSRPATDWWDAYVEAHEEPESIICLSLELLSVHTMLPRI
jgi:hypothetical protein